MLPPYISMWDMVVGKTEIIYFSTSMEILQLVMPPNGYSWIPMHLPREDVWFNAAPKLCTVQSRQSHGWTNGNLMDHWLSL